MRVAVIVTRIVRVPAGTVPLAERGSRFESDCRSAADTGPMLTGEPRSFAAVPRNCAVTTELSPCEEKPPSSAARAAVTEPASMSVAAALTSMSWVAVDPGLLGPPAKKFLPPLTALATVASGNAGAP